MLFHNRVEHLQTKMKTAGIDAAVLYHSRDVFYYAGTGQPSVLLMPAQGKPLIFARRAVQWIKRDVPPFLEVVEAGGLTPFVKYLGDYGLRSGILGLEEDMLPANVYLKIREQLENFQLINISPLVLEQRMIKDEQEINLLKKAALMFTDVHKAVMEYARPGISELELAAEISRAARKAGNEPLPFMRTWRMLPFHDGNIASGENAWEMSGLAVSITGVGMSNSVPWGASRRKIQKGDLLVVDITLNYQGYHSDQTRTYVIGKAAKDQLRLYNSARQVFDKVYANAKAGIKASELYRVAEEEARSLDLLSYFQGCGNDRAPYIGHGLGLEGDELPGINKGSSIILPANCIFTIEPKFIVPALGAVQLEDMVWLKENGRELMSEVPHDLFEIK